LEQCPYEEFNCNCTRHVPVVPFSPEQIPDDSYCIPLSHVCDGISDCSDGIDEANCACDEDEFQCSPCGKGGLSCEYGVIWDDFYECIPKKYEDTYECLGGNDDK